MTILAIEKELPCVDWSNRSALLKEEAAAVWELKKQDILREIWFTTEGKRAVLLMECPSEQVARLRLANLPLVRAKCIDFDVMGLRAYDGFERLFDRGTSQQ